MAVFLPTFMVWSPYIGDILIPPLLGNPIGKTLSDFSDVDSTAQEAPHMTMLSNLPQKVTGLPWRTSVRRQFLPSKVKIEKRYTKKGWKIPTKWEWPDFLKCRKAKMCKECDEMFTISKQMTFKRNRVQYLYCDFPMKQTAEETLAFWKATLGTVAWTKTSRTLLFQDFTSRKIPPEDSIILYPGLFFLSEALITGKSAKLIPLVIPTWCRGSSNPQVLLVSPLFVLKFSGHLKNIPGWSCLKPKSVRKKPGQRHRDMGPQNTVKRSDREPRSN